MRAFIAIPLPEKLCKEIELLQKDLSASGTDVKWVKPFNIHLTLKFLGDVDENQLEPIKAGISDAAGSRACFLISVSGIGAFPQPARPKVIWAGIDTGKEECRRLHKDIDASMEELGFKSEGRAFSAHLTLGRVRSGRNRLKLIESIKNNKDFNPGIEVPVDRIVLFRSRLTPQGPIYKELGIFRLR